MSTKNTLSRIFKNPVTTMASTLALASGCTIDQSTTVDYNIAEYRIDCDDTRPAKTAPSTTLTANSCADTEGLKGFEISCLFNDKLVNAPGQFPSAACVIAKKTPHIVIDP